MAAAQFSSALSLKKQLVQVMWVLIYAVDTVGIKTMLTYCSAF